MVTAKVFLHKLRILGAANAVRVTLRLRLLALRLREPERRARVIQSSSALS